MYDWGEGAAEKEGGERGGEENWWGVVSVGDSGKSIREINKWYTC